MESQFYHFQDPQDRALRKGKKGLLVLLVIMLLAGGLLYAGLYRGIFSPIGNSSSVTPTQYQFPTDTPTPEASPTMVPTVENLRTNNIDKATNLDRSNLSISVENGSGEIGAGNKASDILKNLGYHIISVGNADAFTYENVSIQMKKSKVDYLPLLKSDLAREYTIGTASANMVATSGADAIVIIGK